MKKTTPIFVAISILILLAGCRSKEVVSDNEKAIGVIVVNQQTLEQDSKIYADYSNHQYTFDLDAAAVYFFDYDSETSYAGDQNVTDLVFGANIDSNSIGADATVAYNYDVTGENTVTAYYLYFDGEGIFYEPDKPFSTISVEGTTVIEGDKFRSMVTIYNTVPAEYFVITCYNEKGELQTQTLKPEDFLDYSQYSLPVGTVSVDIVSYDAGNKLIQQETFLQGDTDYTVAYDIGGQILGAKSLYLVWQE